MALTSNTYQFANNTQLDDLFREVYERLGIVGNEQTPLQVQSAIMSANLELSSWPGRGLNLWLIQQHMFSLYPNQPIYVLPQYTVRVLEVVATQPVRLNNFGGTPLTTAGGVAANCFDPRQTAGCTQTAPNGSIGWDYGAGNTNSILYVGVTPLPPAMGTYSTYSLTVEYSFDTINWTTVYVAPTQNYPAYQTIWFVVEQALNARAWRITETGGQTLAIQQIYFSQPNNNSTGDRLLTARSRSEWLAIATKMNTGYPSGYYFDQSTLSPSLSPTIRLWPVPPPSMPFPQTNILYSNYRYAQDITQMFQNAELPQRFYDALVAGLSARLAQKFAPDKYALMKNEAIEAYKIAAATDFENVTLRFTPDLGQYHVY
ncbi:MAG TPA: hypothetical protein VNZ45_09670 [Bacteroidia bacterium]|jgi:hypothetical protein|nr:hypothetical protein [Bacteroidia bacterium]